MRWLDKLIMQMRMLLHRGRAGDQLQNELQFHVIGNLKFPRFGV